MNGTSTTPTPSRSFGQSIGETMKKGRQSALKGLVYFIGIVVYITGVLYAEVHGYTLLIEGIDLDLRVWAIIGIFALGFTALALPLGLHFAFYDQHQRLYAFIFYGLDLALLMANAVVDYLRHQAGGAIPSWGQMYLDYIVPLNPIIAALIWTVLLLQDPHVKRTIGVETLNASIQSTFNDALATAAQDQDYSAQVEQAASQLVDAQVRSLMQQALNGIPGAPRLVIPSSNGRPTLNAHPTDRKRSRWFIFGKQRQRQPVHTNADDLHNFLIEHDDRCRYCVQLLPHSEFQHWEELNVAAIHAKQNTGSSGGPGPT